MTFTEVLERVFARQRELMVEYKRVERLPSPPLPIQSRNSQRVFRDFAQRVTEELTESFEANGPTKAEEWADGLHFLTEMLIFAGLGPRALLDEMPDPRPTDHANVYWTATYTLGLAMNLLKNKPWKQTPVPTDEGRFRRRLIEAFEAYVQVAVNIGMKVQDVHDYYFRKAEVNEARVRGNY